MFKDLFKNIILKGKKSGLTAHDEKVIIITNFILILASLVAFIRFFIYFFADDINYSIISISASIIFLILYFLNTKGYTDFAKFALVIVGSLATGFKELEAGGNAGQIYLILASFGVNFLLFDIKETKKLIIANLICFANVILVIIFPNILHPEIVATVNTNKLTTFTGVISNLIISVFVIWYFVKKSYDTELKLIDTNHLLLDYNKEILTKKQEIEEINNELHVINDDLINQKNIIELKNDEIYASIRYAKRIQSAFLHNNFKLEGRIIDQFILFKPKDIVSGDFYWWAETPTSYFVCVADCTGHGVPGAMLSMLGMVALNDAIKVLGISDLDLILEYLDDYFIKHIKKEKNQMRDGMELSIVQIPKDGKTIYLSGAKRPIVIYHNNIIEIINSSKRYIGDENRANLQYQNISYELKDDSIIYLYTDGFSDQSNQVGKKIGSKNLKELILQNGHMELSEQKEILENFFYNHIKTQNQRDDVTILAIRVKNNII